MDARTAGAISPSRKMTGSPVYTSMETQAKGFLAWSKRSEPMPSRTCFSVFSEDSSESKSTSETRRRAERSLPEVTRTAEATSHIRLTGVPAA
jgi:hypothetical protein